MNLIWEPQLMKFALLTVLIELPLFYKCGYQEPLVLIAYGLANLISNLLLNEGLPVYEPSLSYVLQLFVGEILVVLLEFQLMTYIVKENRRRLFGTVIFTNLISLFYGLFSYCLTM